MGIFDGILLVSDYDNTLRYTEPALHAPIEPPPVPERNIRAVQRFMEEGGRFTVVTGRSLAAFRTHAGTVPTNAPTVVDNGASIYDFQKQTYLYQSSLFHDAVGRIVDILDHFPQISTEIYIPSDRVFTVRPTEWTDNHARLTGAVYTILDRLTADMVQEPICKALLVGEHSSLVQVEDYLHEKGWDLDCELVYSRENLLEMTAPGANKGNTARKLQHMCGCHTLIAVGDGLNDLPMLREADRAFAPLNAVPEVLQGGFSQVCRCQDGSIGHVIEILEQEAERLS